MSALCRKCTATQGFPNQGIALPRERHAAKFGGSLAPRATRCPADAAVKFTPLPPAALPLEVAPGRQAKGRAACVHGASGSVCHRHKLRPAKPWRRLPRLRASSMAPVRSALRGVPIASHLGSVRLDTPLFSGRVEVAKNDANPGASEIRHQLHKGLVPGGSDVADGPQNGVLRTDHGGFCPRAKGPAGRGRRASGGRRAERGAQGVVHERVLAGASQGSRSEGSLSQAAEPNRARHRLCSIKRGEATHHGAEPVSEEKVE